MKSGGDNQNYNVITGGAYEQTVGMRSYALGPAIKFAGSPLLTMVNNWYYANYGFQGPPIFQKSDWIDEIIESNPGESQQQIDALIARVVAEACPQNFVGQDSGDASDPEFNKLMKRLWERESASAAEVACCLKYRSVAGMNQDSKVLISEWDIDWDAVQEVSWGIAQGSEDVNVPTLHWQWWDSKLPKAETLLLPGQESMSLLTTKEMYELMRRVYGGGVACSIM